jgi:hypothetical protein
MAGFDKVGPAMSCFLAVLRARAGSRMTVERASGLIEKYRRASWTRGLQ